MIFTWQALIDRARVYVDDDHKDQDGWISADKWLTLAQVEYSHLYRKWVMQGLVRPAPTVTSFTGPSTVLTGALAIQGVAQDMGGYVRMLTNTQLTLGPDPFWLGSTPYRGLASEWAAHGTSDSVTIELYPPDQTNQYQVRWIPTVAYATDPATTIDLPYGGDEVLVLGMARRALVKESARSGQLEALRMEAEAMLAFRNFGTAIGGPRVRRVPAQARNISSRNYAYPNDYRYWFYL